MPSFFDQIKQEVEGYIRVEDASEEVCELYSVYYSISGANRLDFVDATATELEIDIQSGKRSLTLNIAQNPNINGELGQTGAVLWNSSVVMSRFLAERSATSWDVANLSAIELGSGCGLVGLVLHRLGAKRVVLTDQARMLKLLAKNVDSNMLNSASNKQKRKTGGVHASELVVAEYEWGYPPRDPRVLEKSADVVVVSDCVYHESVAPLLAKTLVDICRSRGDGTPVVAIIGQELRSDLVHQAFVDQLLKDFVVYRVPVNEAVDAFYALYAVWLK
ncbi:hypothetical protein GQ54DRAFT_313121 [Martensiomyces pterosporus]|nr:hypothetical protein GQ54DRAFT_313121 [Martensiomyces pterosporus]